MNSWTEYKDNHLILRIMSVIFIADVFAVCSLFLMAPTASEAQGFLKSSSLIEAAQGGQKKEIEKLLNQGANINVQDEYGESPILAASKRGFVEIVKILLDRGADINLADTDGSTPLIEASKLGHLDVVKLLLSRGANVNLKDKDNETALSYAVQNDLQEIKELLMKYVAQ